jgi:predicted transcriptional regulator of viral defense system
MREKSGSHRRIAQLAERQHGVVSARQMVELGLSKDQIFWEASIGRLHRVHQGAYAVGHRAVSRHGECLAAVLSCGDRALLSHRSAAWLWGLTTYWQPVVEVTAASPLETRVEIHVHSAQALTGDDRQVCEGIPVTAVPRTLLDFAAVNPSFLGSALDRAKRRDLLDFVAIDHLFQRSRGFRGVARLRDALEIYRVPAFTRSHLERRFLSLVRKAGLPQPSMNFFVAGCELDAYWPAERFAVELDTYDYHGDPRAFEADRLRQEDLKLAEIEMVRITGARMDREPEAVTARLRRLLSQRRRDLGRPSLN